METVKSNGRPAFTIDDILADERGQDCVDGSGESSGDILLAAFMVWHLNSDENAQYFQHFSFL